MCISLQGGEAARNDFPKLPLRCFRPVGEAVSDDSDFNKALPRRPYGSREAPRANASGGPEL